MKKAVIDLLRGHSRVQGAGRKPGEEVNPLGRLEFFNLCDVINKLEDVL